MIGTGDHSLGAGLGCGAPGGGVEVTSTWRARAVASQIESAGEAPDATGRQGAARVWRWAIMRS
jgi:hypothetical protein